MGWGGGLIRLTRIRETAKHYLIAELSRTAEYCPDSVDPQDSWLNYINLGVRASVLLCSAHWFMGNFHTKMTGMLVSGLGIDEWTISQLWA